MLYKLLFNKGMLYQLQQMMMLSSGDRWCVSLAQVAHHYDITGNGNNLYTFIPVIIFVYTCIDNLPFQVDNRHDKHVLITLLFRYTNAKEHLAATFSSHAHEYYLNRH
jgi:hypothetical protein